ncbi:DEAD/DEAH box helicase, partial [Nocardia sp. NPDC003345]
MDGSLFSPVVEVRNAFESLPGFLRTPIEMVAFGGELPRADISTLRRMAAELRTRSAELEGCATDIETLLAQEDSVGQLATQLRETLRSYRKSAARLGEDVNALADQAQAAANDAEKWLCVMFSFGIHLAWRIFGLMSSAAAAGPGGAVAAAPAVEGMLVEGRVKVAVMRTGLERAIQAGGARTAARLSGMSAAQFATMLGKAVALPVGVDAGVQAMQVATGDRTAGFIGSDGTNPTGIDLTSIGVAALAGAGGATGGMVAGRVAPMVFPRIESSRVAMGLVHGTAGAIAGLGAASLVAGWPQHYTQVLGPLLNGAFAGGVYARGAARPPAIDGVGTFTPPDAIPAGHDGSAAVRRPIDVSPESKRGWEAAKRAWAGTPEATRAGGERGRATAAIAPESVAAEQRTPSGRPASVSADRAAAGPPGSQTAARPPASETGPVRPGANSESAAPVQRSNPDKAATTEKTAAPRSVAAVGETAPPPKIPENSTPRPAGGLPERPGTPGEQVAQAKTEHNPSGERTAVADGDGNQAPARTQPAADGDSGSPPGVRDDSGSPVDGEQAPPQRETTTDGTGPDGTGETAGPRSDRDRAVDLLTDFHSSSGEHIPESQRLHNLPDEVVRAGLFDSDPHQSMLATMEFIRRGTVSDAVPGGMVLRVEQVEAVFALASRPVEMKPGEGKSLVFTAAAIQRAVHNDSVLLVTTTDGLANREVVKYQKLLSGSGIDVFRADQHSGFGPITEGRPAIVVATGETVGHLANAGHRPPRHVLIDEIDGIIDRGERQFLRSEGAEQAAPEATAQQVFAAHDFLADALANRSLSHTDFGLTRIAEEVGVHPDGTPEVKYWYDGQP